MEAGGLYVNYWSHSNPRLPCHHNSDYTVVGEGSGRTGANPVQLSGNGHFSFQMDSRPGHHFLHLPHFKMHHSLHLPHFHLPHNLMHGAGHGSKKTAMGVPKGCLAVYVGQEEEQQQRFVIPVIYINHPLFQNLLKEAEEEYEFEYRNGTITIPCHVADFKRVQRLIDRELESHNVSCFGSGT